MPWNIKHNPQIEIVQLLTSLEERLVSLHIAFAQIRQLGFKISQFGLIGTIINVPVDIDKVQHALPREINDNKTIAVKLKRKLEYENAYAQGNVRPSYVLKALTSLLRTPLYENENVFINQDWEA